MDVLRREERNAVAVSREVDVKVLHVLYRLMPSGAEKMLEVAAPAYRAAGVECHILANDAEEGPFAPALADRGYCIHRIPWTGSRRHLIDFWRLCRREKFDVVHVHVIRGYAGFAFAARLAGVRHLVKTFHGLFYPTDWMRWLWHVYQRRVAVLLGMRYHAISLSVQENEWKRYRTHTTLVWNWIDEDSFPLVSPEVGAHVRAALGIAEQQFVLLSVGNCHSSSHMEIKNHALILRALARLPEGTRARIIYLHVGAEMEGFPERKLAEELGVARCVRFLGSRSDVYDLLCAANVFVMSSKHEGLGNSVIEALVAGRETLLVRTPGLVDFGKIIPELRYCEPTPDSMAESLGRLVSGVWAPLRPEVLREKALRTFSREVGIRAMLKIYRGDAL